MDEDSDNIYSLTAEESLRKELANEILTSYLENTDESEYLLCQAVHSLEDYLKEISNKNCKECLNQSEKYVAVVHQLSCLADKLFVAKDYSLCCKALEVALKTHNNDSENDRDNDSLLKANLLLKLSSSYLQLNNCQDAIENSLTCLKEGMQKENKVLEMRSCIILANAFQRDRNYLAAISCNNKMLDIGRQLSSVDKEHVEWTNQLECKIIRNISACYNSIGDLKNALIYAKEYLKTVRYGSQDNMTSLYSYVGRLLMQNFAFEEAIEMHETELAICKRFKDRIGMGTAYGNIGLVYAAMGNYILSSEFLRQQFRIAKTMENSDLLLLAVQNQAEAYMKLGKVDLAIENFKSLLKLARENHMWRVQCIAYKNIGKLYQKQGTLNFARCFLEEAMSRAKECDMKEDEIDAEMHLARVLNVLGYYEEARRHYKEVILHFEQTVGNAQCFEILANDHISQKLEDCYKSLQDVLVKLKCYGEALEIGELSRSRIYFNLLRQKNTLSVSEVDSSLPLTLIQMEEILVGLPPNTLVLFYTLSENGYHLWMLRAGKGLVKFVTQNSMATRPIETVARDCLVSLAVSKKGNRCCYESEYRKKIFDKANFNLKAGKSKEGKENHAVRANLVIRNTDECEEMVTNINQLVEYHERGKTITNVNSPMITNSSNSESTADEPTLPSPLLQSPSPLKIHTETTYDSGYDSSCVDDLKRRDVFTQTDLQNQASTMFSSVSPDLEEHRESESEMAARRSEQQKLLHEMFDILFGQIEHLLSNLEENSHLIVVPDGVLNVVPFHLLLDKLSKPLHANLRVSLMPCIAAISKCQTTCHRTGDAIVIGNSSLEDASFKNINGDPVSYESYATEEELNLVSKLLGVEAIVGKAATKDKLIKSLHSAEILHISAVGSMSDGYLLLAPNSHRQELQAETESYVFGLSDICQSNLNASLVLLSSCSQCPHGVAESEEFKLNMATGFLAAGAVAVVVFSYALPHKAQLYVIHQLYRHLEEGKSVTQALQLIYNEMSQSDDMCQPGYWGGIAHFGNDVRVDVKNFRRKGFEKEITEGTSAVRSSVCIEEPCMVHEEFDWSTKAKILQKHLAALISTKESLVVLGSLQDLIAATIHETQKFRKGDDCTKLPVFQISNEIAPLMPLKDVLTSLGYKINVSLEDDNIRHLMLPPWNFDEILQKVFNLVESLHALESLSSKAAFHLSRCLADFDENALETIYGILEILLEHPEQKIHTTDNGVDRLWISNDVKRFLQELGVYEVGTSLHLRNGYCYDQIQKITQDIIIVLLPMYRDGEMMRCQLSSTKLKREAPWFTKNPTRNETKSKNLLAKRILSTNKQFGALNIKGRDWHDATLKSWNSPEADIVQIGPAVKDAEKGERVYHGQVKVKVKPGGTPSSCRFPIIEKRKVTKYDRYQQRENLESIFINNKKDLLKRRRFEICRSFRASSS